MSALASANNNLPWRDDEHNGIIERLWDRKNYSPDFRDFRSREFIPFFIYEPLLQQKGKHNGILLPSESKYLGKAYTLSDHYVMYKCPEAIPYQRRVAYVQNVKTAKSFDRAHVQGEAYALTPRALLNLDRYMHNEYDFYRFEKSVFLPQQESPFITKHTPAIKAWVYIGNPTYWNRFKLEKLSWLKDHVREKWFWA